MDLESLIHQINSHNSDKAALQRAAPVHLWNPDFCGDIDMVIRRGGQWSYMGSPIGRQKIVQLFASVLTLEETPDGQVKYFLVTPTEKIGITVEDLPFVTVDLRIVQGDKATEIWFETNVGDKVLIDAAHPICVHYAENHSEPQPFIEVRRGLKARISRSHFYELVENAFEWENALFVESAGEKFELGKLDA